VWLELPKEQDEQDDDEHSEQQATATVGVSLAFYAGRDRSGKFLIESLERGHIWSPFRA
jgi:hypothetical protein